MTYPKLQHYLPRCYLEGFSQRGMVWIFDREKGEYRKQSTANAAAQNHFYTWTKADGNRDFAIEEWLSKEVEAPFKAILAKLEKRNALTNEDRTRLALFVAVLKFRTPEFRRNCLFMTGAILKESLARACRIPEFAERLLVGAPDGITAETLPDFAEKHFSIKVHDNFHLKTMVEQALRQAAILNKLNWIVFHCPERKSFVTTDAPFVIVLPPEKRGEPVGVLVPDAVKLIPLSEKICLAMTDLGTGFEHRSIGREETREINCALTYECERLVIGPSDALIRSLVPHTGVDKRKAQLRVKVE
jgi:hypothetical protein